MKGDHFCQMIRPEERPIDEWLTMLLHHLPVLVDFKNGQHLGFSPGRTELRPPFLPVPLLLFLRLFVFAHSDTSAVNLYCHTPSSEFAPSRKFTHAPRQQLTLSQRQQLHAALLRTPPHGLFVQPNSLSPQFLASHIE